MDLASCTLRISGLKAEHKKLTEEMTAAKTKAGQIEEELYVLQQCHLHMQEIYRLAQLHFPRLQKHEFNGTDVAEIEKWISRSKTVDGLIAVRDALAALKKYGSASDIKSNLYGLVQKIINGAVYTKK